VREQDAHRSVQGDVRRAEREAQEDRAKQRGYADQEPRPEGAADRAEEARAMLVVISTDALPD
jgi:hypothetical protein